MCSRARAAKLLPRALRGRPVLALLLAVMLGIVLAYYLRSRLDPGLRLLLPVGLALLCLLFCARTRLRQWQPLLLLGLGLGFLLCCGQLASLEACPLKPRDYAIVSGRVSGVPVVFEPGYYRLRLRVDSVEGQSLRCAPIYVYGNGQPPAPGSLLRVDGQVRGDSAAGNQHAFDYDLYLAQQGIAAQLSTCYYGQVELLESGPIFSAAALSQWLRDSFGAALEQLTPQQRALVKGVFLGEKSGLEYDSRTAMSLSGMMHVFAVSGLHVGYVVLLARLLAGTGFRRRWLRLGLTLGLLSVYIGLTGGAASILRASLMALTLLLAELLMEQNDFITTLALAALICLTLCPMWLFSAGFQMSFAAVWGLLVLGPMCCRLLRLPMRGLGAGVGFSMGASLAILPLMAYYFYSVSWWGWLVAPPAIFMAGLAVFLCLLALPFCLLLPAVAAFIMQAAAWAMQALAAAAELLASLPGFGGFIGAPSLLSVLLFYALLLTLLPLLRRYGRRPVLILLPLALVAFVHAAGSDWPQQAQAEEQALVKLTFLDVGQGDCTLVQTADGYSLLIDGGGSRLSPGAVGENVLLPYLRAQGLRQLDLLVSSHPDADHVDGLITVLQYLPVQELLYADFFSTVDLQQQLLAAARQQGTALSAAAAGNVYRLGEYLELRVHSPHLGHTYTEDNDASLVLELSCGEVDVLFCGDAPGSLLAQTATERQLEAELVKLPHHGSYSGYDEDFYRQLAAEAVVISCGRQNSYGHPHRSVVEYWQDRAEIYRTDQQGAITFYLDGDSWHAVSFQQETE